VAKSIANPPDRGRYAAPRTGSASSDPVEVHTVLLLHAGQPVPSDRLCACSPATAVTGSWSPAPTPCSPPFAPVVS